MTADAVPGHLEGQGSRVPFDFFQLGQVAVELHDERLHRAAVDPDDLADLQPRGHVDLVDRAPLAVFDALVLRTGSCTGACPPPAWGRWERPCLRTGRPRRKRRSERRRPRRATPCGRWRSKNQARARRQKRRISIRFGPSQGMSGMMAREPRLAPTRSMK